MSSATSGSDLYHPGRHHRHGGHHREGGDGAEERGPIGARVRGARRALRAAIERIQKAPIEELIITNTIPLNGERAKSPKVVVLSVANLLSRAILSIHEESSVSSLFV